MTRFSRLLRQFVQRFARSPAGRPAREAAAPSSLPRKTALIARLGGWSCDPLARRLERSGYPAEVVDGGPAALNALAQTVPALVVVVGPAGKGAQGSSRSVRIGRYQVPVNADAIVAVDGKATTSLQDLTVYLESQTSVGETVELTIGRGGTEQTIQVALGSQTG